MQINKVIMTVATLSLLSATAFAAPMFNILPRAPQIFASGERVLYANSYGTVLNRYFNQGIVKYRVAFDNGTIDEGYTAQHLYKTDGCMQHGLCVGERVLVGGYVTNIVGIIYDTYGVKYAVNMNGTIDTGYTENMVYRY